MPRDMKNIQWLGAGPQSLFEDSRRESTVDRYEETLAAGFPREGWPRERGHKRAVRWITVRNDAGRGLFLGSEAPFIATVSPYSSFQLGEAVHPDSLTPDSALTVHVDQLLCYGDKPTTSALPPEALTVRLRMRALLPEDRTPWDFLKRRAPIDPQAS